MNEMTRLKTDRAAPPRLTTAILVGKHVVVRRPIPRTPYHTYTVMDGNTPVWSLMSYPDADECEHAIWRHRAAAVQADQTKIRRPVARTGARRAKKGAL
ncbi:hypothetical protein [Cupriavidus basilensis]|uniref:hypothetical protein n=1 Tax=Cupriavidus basilensis TaxID=68895 RepID=UPI0007C72A05|nr:hypothetical protein [Cupriavidus basilensis]